MQTFLAYPSFTACARALDRGRLGKQRVECLQLLNALTGRSTGWRNHPAARMWAQHLPQLVGYSLAICSEWVGRGYRDTCAGKIRAIAAADGIEPDDTAPDWLTPAVTESHQSNLLRKAPDHYRPIFGSDLPDDLPYVWPAPSR